MTSTRFSRGFTLLELLVAIAVFAVLSAMSYAGLNAVLAASEQTTRQAERLQAVQLTFALLQRDLLQFVDRPVRDEYGDTRPSLETNGPEGGIVSFTRGGWRNPTNQIRSHLQRVSYGLDEDRLVRATWAMLDRGSEAEAQEVDLLDGVDNLEVRILDEAGTWHEDWPSLTGQGGQPVAAEFLLETEDWGELRRLFAFPR